MDLDDPSTYASLDSGGMGRLIAAMPLHCRVAYAKAQLVSLPPNYVKIRRIVLMGMGGSAIAGDLVAGLQEMEREMPIHVQRGYQPPADTDSETLAIGFSHSGNTEETLAAFKEALAMGAQGVAITAGGELARLAKRRKVPILPIEAEGPPRASVGWGVSLLVALLHHVGAAPDRSQDLSEAVKEMQTLSQAIDPTVPTDQNPAKRLAAKIGDRIPVIFAAGHLEAVARRWRTQIAENAKSWAFHDALPEANHNTVEGLRLPTAASDALCAVLLRSTLYRPEVQKRFGLTKALLEGNGIDCEEPMAQSETPLSQILTTVLLGDFVSYYMAMARDVDPSPTPNLDRLKHRMTVD